MLTLAFVCVKFHALKSFKKDAIMFNIKYEAGAGGMSCGFSDFEEMPMEEKKIKIFIRESFKSFCVVSFLINGNKC